MIGKRIIFTGMTLEIIAENKDSWKCHNITTNESVFIKKAVLENAIKLGKAEVISELNTNE